MKLESTPNPSINIIQGYDDSGIKVNEQLIITSFIIMPEKLLPNWRPRHFSELTVNDFDAITELDPEIIIIGSGKKLYFPEAKISQTIISKNIGFEIMDTYAACRCYSILVAEGRNVAAGLIIE